MQNTENAVPTASKRMPWNKGKLTGAKPPLRPKHVWSIRTKLQVEGRTRDLAMFNLAIDSKLRGCDVVALKVEDVAPNGYSYQPSQRVTDDRPIAVSDGHDFPWLIDEGVPGVAAVIDDVVEGFEDAVRQPVLAHELPDIFLAV